METPDMQATLQSCRFLKNISPAHLDTISEFCSVDHYAAGTTIFRQGILARTCSSSSTDTFFWSVPWTSAATRGRWSSMPWERAGPWVLVHPLGEPHVLLSSANCQKDSTVIRLKGGQLRKCMEEDTAFGFFMLERLAFLLRDRIQAAYGAMDKI